MNVTLWLALLLQFASIVLLRLGLGKLWLRRPATLLVLASLVYDGVSQVLLSFPSVGAWDIFRNGIQQGYIDEANLVMSAGMLALTVTYILSSPALHDVPSGVEDGTVVASVLDWRLLALACAPLAVLTYEGRGYGNGTLTIGAGAPLATSVAGEFFVLIVLLTSFAFLLRHGNQWFLPTLAMQSVLLAAAGERSPVITDALVLILLLCCASRPPRRAHIHIAAALTVLAVLAITGLRAEQGRSVFYSDSGLGTRTEALGAGLIATPISGTPGLAAQAAERLDGTAFAGAILQGEALGQPRLDAAGVPESLLLAVPSAAWHSKLGDAALNPALAELGDFGLQRVNFLPGLAGLYIGFLSPPWLILFLAGLGVACGRGEIWLFRSRTPARLVLLAGALTAALHFEEGLPEMAVALRAGAVMAMIAWLAGIVRSRQGAIQRYAAKSANPPPLPQ